MHRLVALSMPGGPRFLEELVRAFDAGDAVLPVDHRLPAPAVTRLLAAMAPAELVDDQGERTRLDGARPVEEGDALVVATSGTTGEPKGVVLTHAAVEASARATSAALGAEAGADRWLACLPLAHMGGLAVVTRALVTGVPVEIHPGFDPVAVSRAARVGGATLTSLVSTALGRLGRAVADFRAVLIGGSAPPPSLPPQVVTTYGLTETGSGVVYDGVPLPGVELRIGGEGEVLVRCPMLLRAYRDGSDPRGPDGWFATGDAGELDADGRLSLLGRLSELIISGGENVWPLAVERVLRADPRIREVAVAGRPDDEWGERVVAFVVLEDGAELPPSLGELRDLVKSELGPWSAPGELLVVDELPRTASGKVRRPALESLLGRS